MYSSTTKRTYIHSRFRHQFNRPKYKIAVEVKGSNHIYGNFFSYVSDMFARLQKTDSYDKFLSVSDHIKNVNNHFSHHGSSSNIEIIDIDEIHNWIERLEQSSSDQSENPYDILIHLRKFNKSIIRCIACAPEQLYNLEWERYGTGNRRIIRRDRVQCYSNPLQ